MRANYLVATFLAFLYCVPAQAEMLTFTAPNVANPPQVVLANHNVGVADTFQLWNVNNGLVDSVLVAQGYTNEYSWFTNTNKLANNAVFNVVDGSGFRGYLLRSSGGNPSTNNQLDESMHVTLNIGATTPPTAGPGQTVTQHWLQLLNEDRPYPLPVPGPKNYGFAIAGLQGYWQIDNADLTNGTGGGSTGSSPSPFYDIAFKGWTATEIGDDPTVLSDGLAGAYLHFYDIPVWDVQSATSDTIYLADTGFTWGFAVAAPEPASFSLMFIGMVLGLAFGWYHWRWRMRRVVALVS